MATESELTTQLRSLQSSYETAKSDNAALEGRIEKLNSALAVAQAAQKDAKSLLGNIKKMKADDAWLGKNQGKFDSKKSTSETDAQNYLSQIETMVGEIKSERWKLQLQVNYLVKFMSSIESSCDSISRQLSDLLNGE